MKLLTVLLFLVASAYANPAITTVTHRYQANALRIIGEQTLRGGRIVGGSDSRIEDHPHQIALFYFRRHTCGASVLNENTIVSAAHCTS